MDDLLSVALALLTFALLVAAIKALDRIWAPPRPLAWRSRFSSSFICSMRCSAGSGS